MDTAEYDTNTVLLSQIASITFRIYKSSPKVQSRIASNALELENTLRQEGHLVLYDSARRGLWHFQLLGNEGHEEINSHSLDSTLRLCGQELELSDEGGLEPASLQKTRSQPSAAAVTPTSSFASASGLDPSQQEASVLTSQDKERRATAASGTEIKAASIPTRTVYGSFIAALLLSISSAFCSRTGAIPLDYRTLLLASHESHARQCPILATLKAYLTTTGTLVISLTASCCNGLSSTPMGFIRNSAPIIAAPFGLVTNHQIPTVCEPGTANFAQTPNTQVLSLHAGPDVNDSLWKQACLNVLKLRGVVPSSVGDCAWVNLSLPKHRLQNSRTEAKRLQSSGSTVTVPWPAPLCFHKKMVEIPLTNRVSDMLFSGHDDSYDPLSSARAWFHSSTDRIEKTAKQRAERALASKEAHVTDYRASKASAQSPSVPQRPSTAAPGTVYPTPPDGVQHPSGVTPSIEGTFSSPNNIFSALPESDTELAAYNTSGMVDAFDTARELGETKHQRGDNNPLGDAEHLFGDMSGNMFSDHDITEADFNFFDEQPGDIDIDVTMSDVGIENHPSSAAFKVDEGLVETAKPAKAAAPPDQDVVIFAKPELKHARSSQNDLNQRGQDTRSSPFKRELSPFDPHTVFKRVRSCLAARRQCSAVKQSGPSRTARIFDSLNYDSTLSSINKKYAQGGQYDYRKIRNFEKAKLERGMLPETEYLKRLGKQAKRPRDRYFHAEFLIKGLMGIGVSTSQASSLKFDGSLSDDDDSSIGSDSDYSSCTTDQAMSPLRPGVKLVTTEDDTTSQVTSLRDAETTEEPDQQLFLELPQLSKTDSPELPLVLLFSDPEPLFLELILSDGDLIHVAQILTDQAAIGWLDIAKKQEEMTLFPGTSLQRPVLSVDGRNAVQVLREIVLSFLRGAKAIDLRGFLDVADIPLSGQPTRLQARPIGGKEANAEVVRPSKLYQIPGPHLEVRRSETKLSVLPSAVLFWESLGLAPSSGGKDVNAVCVFPGWDGMADNVQTFLHCLKSMYETLKLGSFESMPRLGEVYDGLLPVDVGRISTSSGATMTGPGPALVESMDRLLGALLNLDVLAANTVVYFVYSPSSPGSIVEACIAFQRFFESYRKKLTSQREVAQTELVLQLVSSRLLSSPTEVVMPAPAELFRLCMETYDRCTLIGVPMPAPAIRLEQQLPRILDFKLTVSPSASIIRENSCIHVAYAQSVDERWITTAWTDDRGNRQETASYCLGRKGRPQSRSPNEVAHEIWESTLELISTWKVHWRVVITKCGPMDRQEIDHWTDLAGKEKRASVSMILMTVDTGPALQLIPPAVKLPPPSATLCMTPVSTPQASTMSPEQSGMAAMSARDANAGAATPGADGVAETDYDVSLCDITDQTWGAIVGHRLNNSSSVTEAHPALVSGYLIKRTGSRTEDAPALMEVNLIHTDANPRTYELLLREVLNYFRGLGTLARARGVVQRETDVRPWHIAVVEKAVRALYLLM